MDVDDNMPTSIPIPSKFERVLIEGGYNLINQFFASWPPDSVLHVSRVNFVMASAIRGYIVSRWDHRKLLSNWVVDVDRLLAMMDATESFICGPAAAEFFHFGNNSCRNLDICVTSSGFTALTEILGFERYRHGTRGLFASSFSPTMPEKVFTFKFHRDRDVGYSITAHLVRGDPLEFIIGCGTTNTMNFITSTRAVSVFPRSSFVYGRYATSAQRSFDTTSAHDIIPIVHNTNDYRKLGNAERSSTRELQEHRRAGDHLSWIIPFTLSSTMSYPVAEPRGPFFSVDDRLFVVVDSDSLAQCTSQN